MSTISRRGALKSTAAISMLASFGCGKSQGPASNADLANLDAIATAQAIKNGDVTALEVIDAAITRAESANQKIHAIVSPYFDTARDKATAAPEGPWFGVPTFIKDLNDVIGQRTSFGSRAYANYIASEQSPLVDAIFGTGLISLGKSSTPEFGLTATTEPMLGEATRNPWNTDYSVGGSSGGAAALAAARVTPVAHASDGGGSIRIPASCCGLVGLKPSRGRTPLPPRKSPRPVELTTQLAVTRTVRDTAAFLSMMELDNELPQVGLVEGPSSDRKKIAFFTETPTGAAVDPEVIASTRAVADQLEDLGHEVSEIASPFDAGVLQDFTIYWGAGAAGAVADWEKAAGRPASYTDFEPWTFGMIEYFTARQSMLEAAIGRLLSFERLYQTAFSGIDLMLSPVLAAPPPKIGHLSPRHAFPLGFDRISEYVSFTQYHNVSGAPAISLPLGVSSSGLPIGAQIAAMPGHERSILEVAYELEEAMPWAGRTPAGFA